MEIKENNPWGRIPEGKKAIPISTDPNISRRFLWALDEEKNPSLLFEAKEDSTLIPSKNKLPKLKGIAINELSSKGLKFLSKSGYILANEENLKAHSLSIKSKVMRRN